MIKKTRDTVLLCRIHWRGRSAQVGFPGGVTAAVKFGHKFCPDPSCHC